MSPFDFKRLMVSSALSWGNAYAEIERNLAGKPAALWPIHPSRVTVLRDEESKELFYRVSQSLGSQVDLPAESVFHIRNIGSDGLVGLSVIGLAARTIGMGIAAEEFGANLYQNQAIPSGVLEHPQQLSAEAQQRLRDQFGERYGGARHAGKPLVLEEGLKFHPLSFKPEDLQFLESRRFTVEEIARWFGIPPHKLADMEHATFSNIEHLSIEVVNDAILPWCQSLEQEADYKLLNSIRGDYYTKIDIRGLLRGDSKSRAEFYSKMFPLGAFSINEIRFLEDMGPIENGDTHFVPLNFTTLDNAIRLSNERTEQPELSNKQPVGAGNGTENTDEG
jgi:HK97 family phage portal protein